MYIGVYRPIPMYAQPFFAEASEMKLCTKLLTWTCVVRAHAVLALCTHPKSVVDSGLSLLWRGFAVR